jgi:hypothetical protein
LQAEAEQIVQKFGPAFKKCRTLREQLNETDENLLL